MAGKKRLAVIGCKKTKKGYPCTVSEMYGDSSLHQQQMRVIEAYYDDWILLSTKYGVLRPADRIAPYDMTFTAGLHSYGEMSDSTSSTTVADDLYKANWGTKVASDPVWQEEQWEHIDLWIANTYWSNFAHLFKPKATWRRLWPDVSYIDDDGKRRNVHGAFGHTIKRFNEIIELSRPTLFGPGKTLEEIIEMGLVDVTASSA